MTSTARPLPDDAGPASTERFNSVLPELGSGPGWDRSDLGELMRLHPGADGALYSPHAHVNAHGALYGGQTIGQALMAARHGMEDQAQAHCLQVNFLNAGRPAEEMRYEVRTLMRGRTFCVRQVTGTQGERVVITANVSFQRPEAGPDHQLAAPAALPDPDSLPALRETMQRYADRIPAAAAQRLGGSRTLDLRPVDPEAFLFKQDAAARCLYWVRIKPRLPDDAGLHQAVLGYLSDYWFSLNALTPHVAQRVGSGLYVASLNHTVWFHRPVRADEWLLVDGVSPFTGSARGLTTGQFYRRDGTLVATVAQEGLYRGWVERADGGFEPPGMSDKGL